MAPAKKAAKKAVEARRVERERAQFTQLLARNPNYFGTFPDFELKPVKKIVANTTYEELTCVAYSPERDRLEATIAVKQPNGYAGGLCQAGSREFVRFYVDDGTGWTDAGLVGVEVHDLAAGEDCDGDPLHPVSYVASLEHSPQRKWCGTPVLPRVRAILSWQVAPPANQPDWQPVWGHVHECHVQVRPRRLVIRDIFELVDVEPIEVLPPGLEDIVDSEVPEPPVPPPVELADLADLYAKPTKRKRAFAVPPHRFGYSHLAQALSGPVAASQETVADAFQVWKGLDLDWADALGTLVEKTAGDVTYEELECVGLDNNVDALVGTFRVKLSSGYSGGLCTAGSTEYVAFWVDWDDTCTWTYAGTVEVKAHDIPDIPDEGLCYAAVLPVDLSQVQRPCDEPVIGRVRAVLSWNAPPSTTDPDALPHWGNRVDVHVQVRPGPVVDPDHPRISILGGVATGMIDDATGLTTPGAVLAQNGLYTDWIAPHSRPCPFAGRVAVQSASVPAGTTYRVRVRRPSQPWQNLTTPFFVVDKDGNGSWITPGAGGWTTALAWTQNTNGMLAFWNTSGDDLWEVGLEIFASGIVDVHRIQLDNTLPEPGMLELTIGPGNCGKYTVGTTLTGTFVARDTYFARYALGTSPFAPPPGALTPTSSTVQTPLGGTAWSLDTTGMQPCGYVIRLTLFDRAVVNSAWTGRQTSTSQGFCLEAAEE